MRKPLAEQSLENIRSIAPTCGKTVIDVGIMRSTKFLMTVFKESYHYLFEPAHGTHKDIIENYTRAGIEFGLHGVALSDAPGSLYLHEQSINKDFSVTHSKLSPNPQSNAKSVTVKEIEVATLDGFFSDKTLTPLEYLVKIDVDGHEEQIIRGGEKVIRNAAVVVIEAPKWTLMRRGALVESLGFQLFDVVDPTYYCDQLWQVDLVLINNDLIDKEVKFRPREFTGGKIDLSRYDQFRG